MKNQYC